MILRSVIIDDEQSAIDTLTQKIHKHLPKLRIVGSAKSVEEGITLLSLTKPQIVFLDIQMSDGTGFDLLKKINTIDFKVIITTAYNEFAIQAIKFSALDYLLKPVDEEELVQALEKAEQSNEQQYIRLKLEALLNNLDSQPKRSKRLLLNSADSIEVVEINEIIRCEANNNYTEFILINRDKVLISKTLKEFEKLLGGEGFFRLHASHLINLSFVKKIDKKNGNVVIMKDNSAVPVSVRKKDELMKMLKYLE